MNVDCLFLILERLDFVDLLSMAQINEQFSTLAADVYRRLYSEQRIVFDEWEFEHPDKLKKLMNETDTTINTDAAERINKEILSRSNTKPEVKIVFQWFLLLDYETVLMTFKHFGAEIKYLTTRTCTQIAYNNSQIKQSSFGYLMCRYISESLVDIEFVYNADQMLKHITKPLINVESVAFSQGNCFRFTPDLAQTVKTLFPQMKRLELSDFEQDNDHGYIQFENVTTLVIRDGSHTSPANVHFPHLQVLRAELAWKRPAEYIAFLNEHSHLSELHLTGLYMDDLQFQQLTENLKDLVELTLEYERHPFGRQKLGPTAIVEFLRSHDKVKQLNAINFANRSIDELQNQLKHEWNIKINENDVCFERI